MPETADGLTVILPVFNAEKTLGKTASEWLPVLNSLDRHFDLLIVDDGSSDGTRSQAEHIAGRNNSVRVLHHETRRGLGACIRTGLAESTQPLVFYTSTDHAWHPSDLTRMLKSLDIRDEYTGKQVELVNGHRRGTAWPDKRKMLNSIYRWFVRIVFGHMPEPAKGWLGKSENRFWWKCRILFGLRVGDINSKFKLIRRSVLDRMVVQADGDFVNAEILSKANFLGCMMDEVVLTDRDPPGPVSDMRREMWRVFHDAKFRSSLAKPPESIEQPVPVPAN